MQFDRQFVHRVIPEASIVYDGFPSEALFSVDSRTIQAGELFVALQGHQTDGHLFIKEVLERNAAGLIINNGQSSCIDGYRTQLEHKLVITVPDTMDALTRLASAWRSQFTYPIIGITGSVGKTTTKEMVASICAQQDISYLVSQGNQNTRIGISLNILRMRPWHQVGIFEIGINKRHEMAELALLVRPTIAVITNIGHCHMEGLGSLYNIAIEKRDIFSCFTESNIGIVYGDQSLLARVSYNHPTIKFGSKVTNHIQARRVKQIDDSIHFLLKIYKERRPVIINSLTMSSVNNILAAASVAYVLGIPIDTIVKAIEKPPVVTGRFEMLHLANDKGTIIHDAYNANPESMKSALLAFEHIKTNAKKIAIIGDMLELGSNSPFWHRQLGRFLRKIRSLDHVILVGESVEWMKKTLPIRLSVHHVLQWQDAIAILDDMMHEKSMILVKGSLGMGLRNLVNRVTHLT